MSVEIRKANATDAQAILELATLFATSFVVEEQEFFNSYSEILISSAAYLSVAQISQETVGYLLGFDHSAFFANGRVAWVEEIMVSELFRRQNIGQLLMQDFELWAAARKCKLVALSTRRAAPFYQALGYEESATYFRKLL